ncbi:MAG: rRNA maturation RNAse YbeY [Patescibacteria group bacterium]
MSTSQAWIKEVTDLLIRFRRKKNAAVAVFLVSDLEMNRLKKELLSYEWFSGLEAQKIKREKVVDVLAFPEPKGFVSPERREKMLGEIYINKKATGTSRHVFAKLLIHGFLHLLGYRHMVKHDTMRMKRAEKNLWDHILSSGLISEHRPSKR